MLIRYRHFNLREMSQKPRINAVLDVSFSNESVIYDINYGCGFMYKHLSILLDITKILCGLFIAKTYILYEDNDFFSENNLFFYR